MTSLTSLSPAYVNMHMFPVILVECHALSYLLDNAPNQTALCFCVYFGCFYRLWQTVWGYLTSLCSSSSSFNVHIVNRPPAASGVCLWAAETCCFWTMSSSNLAGQIFAQFLGEDSDLTPQINHCGWNLSSWQPSGREVRKGSCVEPNRSSLTQFGKYLDSWTDLVLVSLMAVII